MNSELASQIADKHSANLASVKTLTETVGKAINTQIDRDNPDELTGHLQQLSALQATASYALAMSEQLYNEKLFALTQDERYQKLSATDKKMLFAGLAKTEIYYVTLNERYSRSLTHAIESIRSILSFKKAEMELSRFQTT